MSVSTLSGPPSAVPASPLTVPESGPGGVADFSASLSEEHAAARVTSAASPQAKVNRSAMEGAEAYLTAE